VVVVLLVVVVLILVLLLLLLFLLLLPPTIGAVYSAWDGLWLIDCKVPMKAVTWKLGDKEYLLEPEDYIMQVRVRARVRRWVVVGGSSSSSSTSPASNHPFQH